MKEKIISVKHYQNPKLKLIEINGATIRPIYFRIRYKRRQTELRAACFDVMMNNTPSAGIRLEYIISQIEKVNGDLINEIIKELTIDNEFSLEQFKITYEKFSVNAIDLIDDEINRLAFSFLKKHEMYQLIDLCKLSDSRVNAEVVQRHIREIDHFLVRNYDIKGIPRLIFQYNDSINHLIEFKYELAKNRKFSPVYISIWDWNQNFKEIINVIKDVAPNAAMNYEKRAIDGDKRLHLSEYFLNLVTKIKSGHKD